MIAVTLGGTTTVLMDGVITHTEVRSEGGTTALFVAKGKDLTALMDIFALDGLPYPAMPPALRVLVALAKYAAFGVVPLVIPSVIEDVPIPIERIPRHQGTDYAYIKALAHEVGYVFYIDPGPALGHEQGLLGPGDPRRRAAAGARPGARRAAQDGQELGFRFDKEKKELPIVFIQEPLSKAPIPIPIPDITPLNPPLGAGAAAAAEAQVPERHGEHEPARRRRCAASATPRSTATRCSPTGSLDVARYGHVLKSRGLVGVRGAGEAFDGLYYVTSVTPTMKRGEFTQTFSLARNGLLSTVPTVPA